MDQDEQRRQELRRKSHSHLKELLSKDNIRLLERVESCLFSLTAFNAMNLRNIVGIFTTTSKVLVTKQNRTRRQELKAKEIRAALQLISFHYDNTKGIDVKNHSLSELLGRNLTETHALDYYNTRVVGSVKDIYGNEIIIDADGQRHLYKEDGTGKHIVCSENFMSMRAKRLPWIKWTLNTTSEIYKRRDDLGDWIILGYAQSFVVPHPEGTTTNYLLVIVRKKHPQDHLRFVTSYHMEDHEDFLKRIEPFQPFVVRETS